MTLSLWLPALSQSLLCSHVLLMTEAFGFCFSFVPIGNQRCGLVSCVQQRDAELCKEAGFHSTESTMMLSALQGESWGGPCRVRGFGIEHSLPRQFTWLWKAERAQGTSETLAELFCLRQGRVQSLSKCPSPCHPSTLQNRGCKAWT